MAGKPLSIVHQFPWEEIYIAALLVVLITIAGCGSGDGGFDPNQVTVRISPPAATIAVGEGLILRATVTGLCSTCVSQIFEWSVTENNGNSCTWFDSPPLGPCPGGTIELGTAGGNFLTVTYHAPSNSGTFHVVAEWRASLEPSSIKKQGTSVITVTP